MDFDDVVDALTYGTGTLKPSDDFDRSSFLDFLQRQRALDRGTPDDIRRAVDMAHELQVKRWEARDPWDKLDIDWDEMHPNARDILDDPQDWSFSDDFSPHGNDTGADIFADWTVYQNLTPEEAACEIGWGPEFDLKSDLCWKDWVEINLALPFAHIKKTGTCPPDLAAKARTVLRHDLEKVATQSWEHVEEYTKRLSRYCDKLDRFI
ncbi:hypothetical protein [uncultured Litoreibacter sp.]|uniref:hypothetical protein n=1 Tax=uncultured Litoreibacter sp. TaxID=1392394 RepID=UPI0026272201|nr:hypothetical protein [uncultured Litoreibacter sp.]